MKHLLFPFALLLLVATSCTERIDLTLNSQAGKLVVNAFISAEPSQQTVWLSQSSPYFVGAIGVQPVSGASVWLNGELLTENDTAPGSYHTRADFSVAESSRATLRVEYDFDGNGTPDVFTAEETMTHAVQLDTLMMLPMMDTNRYVAPFGIAALFTRNLADGYFSADMLYGSANGRRYNLSKDFNDYGIGSIPPGSGIVQAPFTFLIGGDTTTFEASGDTMVLCPFDTLLIRINSLSEFTYTYYNAAQTEYYGSNPMFGGPPANVPTNIEGGNVVGCFGLRNPSAWKSIIMPMNLSTLEGTWAAQDGSGTKITIDASGNATFANGEKKGQAYFTGVKIDAAIRGFYELPAGALPLRLFRMASYREFYDVNTLEGWRRERRGFF